MPRGRGPLNTRRIVAGLAVLTSAALGIAGCHSGSASTSQTQATAKDSLLSSLGALGTTSYAISLTTPKMTASGSVDPVGNVVTVTARGTHAGRPAKIQALAIQQATWAKIDLGSESTRMGIKPSKWLLLDPAKLTAGSLPFDPSNRSDAFDLGDVLDGVISVSQASSQHYAGTIDLSGVVGVNSIVPAGSSLGTAAASVPFVATVDLRGRLIDLRVDGGSGHPDSFDFGISDYSAATPTDPPNDVDVVAAPSAAYSLLPTNNLR
jgi:hypothetical protein